ncbi:MAG: hypothetical protein F2555_04110 [Actinobacteria bacterium]|uniref:Unannotated protein n=1 Tax=freshwater metagenome TaxID=449393 RepID=A0A6J6EA94_9ZZZZ|nr:hypothetical protein [Actinomycetota bacterium]
MSNQDNVTAHENSESVAPENIVDGVRRELEEIDSSDLSEHAARFEALHKKLQDSLNSIDGL